MKISIVGLGFVGLSIAVVNASKGFYTYGIDTDTKKIKNLKEDVRKFEPRIALDGGNDGLDLIKKVIYKTKYILKVKGMLALEIGNEQYKKVSKILTRNKFIIRYLVKDNNDNVRCILSILSN